MNVAEVGFGSEPFAIDPLPRMIPAEEWDALAAGLAQRARALNCFLRDAYDQWRIVAEGVITADVIDVKAETPGLEAMLKRFSSEHWHDEDEVRLIVEGRGIFHIHPTTGPVFALEVEPGDLIRVDTSTY